MSGLSWHRLLGLTLATDLALATRLPGGEPPADLLVTATPEPPLATDLTDLEPIFTSPLLDADGNSRCHLVRAAGYEVLRFSDGLDFWLSPEGIEVQVLDAAARELVEIHLLGTVLAYWLERSGIPVLHASAVVDGGRAVGFLAGNRGGKSSLAAASMELGRPLLTDDLLAVEIAGGEVRARPGYPQMRFWPEAARRFAGARAGHLPRVHPRLDKRRLPVGPDGFGSFHPQAVPLAQLYLPERIDGGGGVDIEPLSASQALVELLARSFIPRLASSAGREGERFERLARLAERVPLARLVYPSGYESLPEVARHVLADEG